ncbi:retinol dehydrogenase 12-like [Ischnura elegans]|uniref:retinol dehydrogenase 12-like n=1 Tax=Ischnura elegans TaxID=197161 RepID=UPI001ED89337|nr:retinol dehydrogenase 12-like [Ischnura elegans]
MVQNSVIVFVSAFLGLLLLRKYREFKWGYFKNMKSLEGRTFIVTGANSGIGKETARELVKRGASVIMACRNLTLAQNAIDEIRKTVTTGELIPKPLDLASLDSIRTFSNNVIRDFPKINVLINNAGVYVNSKDAMLTRDGFELHFGVNHLGHFLLTNLLLEKLAESQPSRVVTVSSLLMQSGQIDFENLNCQKETADSLTKMRSNQKYCNSKLANFLFTRELARKTAECDITALAVCPGFAYTNLFRDSSRKWYQYILFSPIIYFYMRSANQGAQTVVMCAVSDEVGKEHSGQIYRDCKIFKPKLRFTSSPSIEAKLWDVSAEMVGLRLK